MTAQALLTTNAAPAHEREGYWGDLVQRSFGRPRSRTYGDERFHGEIRRFQLRELLVRPLSGSRGMGRVACETIARALQCSKRALHRAFEDRGETLHRHLWHSRLELARRQLEDSRDASRSITSILLGAGFASAAHFSRLFRQCYGASPREWRARAAAVRSAS